MRPFWTTFCWGWLVWTGGFSSWASSWGSPRRIDTSTWWGSAWTPSRFEEVGRCTGHGYPGLHNTSRESKKQIFELGGIRCRCELLWTTHSRYKRRGRKSPVQGTNQRNTYIYPVVSRFLYCTQNSFFLSKNIFNADLQFPTLCSPRLFSSLLDRCSWERRNCRVFPKEIQTLRRQQSCSTNKRIHWNWFSESRKEARKVKASLKESLSFTTLRSLSS